MSTPHASTTHPLPPTTNLERLELLVLEAGVDHKEEDGRHVGDPLERVLDRGEVGNQLRRQVGLGDASVVRRKLVPPEAERTDPAVDDWLG